MPIHIGEIGTSLGPLRPSGDIRIAGRRYPARCLEGFLDKDIPVVVVGGDDFQFLVRPRQAISLVELLPGFGNELPTQNEVREERDELQKEEQQHLTRWERFEFGPEEYVLVSLSLPFMIVGYLFAGWVGVGAGFILVLLLAGFYLFFS